MSHSAFAPPLLQCFCLGKPSYLNPQMIQLYLSSSTIVTVYKHFWISQLGKETSTFSAPSTIALLSSWLPIWPHSGRHMRRLSEASRLSYVPRSCSPLLDLNPKSCESAVMRGQCFSDVSHLYSWERFVMRQQRRGWESITAYGRPEGERVEWTADSGPCRSYQEFAIILQEWVADGSPSPCADAS